MSYDMTIFIHRSRNPTPKTTDLIPTKWAPVRTSFSPEYLVIGNSRKITMDRSLHWYEMTFWNDIIEQLKFLTARSLKDEL
jgi:hypothetical protein